MLDKMYGIAYITGMKLASHLKQHRARLDLTQAELAMRAGVSRQLVGAAEVGRNLPRVDAAIALAAALQPDHAELADRVRALSGSTSDVEKALQTPAREGIRQQADEATFQRRALA